MSATARFFSVTQFLGGIITLFLLILTFGLSTSIAEAQGGAGVSIKPATIAPSAPVEPGEVQYHTLNIENLSDNEQIYYLFVRNISGVQDGGIPIFATDNSAQTGFELSDWVSLSQTEVTIPAGGSAPVDITITVPDNASPGGHFGGVFVSVEPPKIKNSGAAVGYQVASILSFRVDGEVIELADIRQFATDRYVYSTQNVEFMVRIENKGNVLVQPRGPLEIYNMLGNKVATFTFNEDQSGVFPYSTRDFEEVVWEREMVGFGRYEAVLSPVYGQDGAKHTMSSTVTFWILPMNIIGPALGVLAFLFLIIFVFVRVYIKRSLGHLHQSGRRIVRRNRRGGSSATLLLIVVTLTVTALFLIVLLALFA